MSQRQGSSTALSRGARAQAVADALAEAKAWRDTAPFSAGDYLTSSSPAAVRCWDQIPSRIYENMRERGEAHTDHPAPFRCLSHQEICLFSLFMALECEDEARSLRCQGAAKCE